MNLWLIIASFFALTCFGFGYACELVIKDQRRAERYHAERLLRDGGVLLMPMPDQFAYNSAYFLSFDADGDGGKQNRYFINNSSAFDRIYSSYENLSVLLTVDKKSLPFKEFPLIRINYDLSGDQPGYMRLRKILMENLRGIKFPAKSYIAAHGAKDSDYISQYFLRLNGE